MHCKISSDINFLNKINKSHSWIPSQLNIRPNSKVLDKKKIFLEKINIFYESFTDYIYNDIFEFNSVINDEGKIKVLKENITEKKVFEKNMFPYDVPENTKHYIMWYSYNESNNLINEDIKNNIYEITNSFNFDFVWYENPKKSMENIFHVHVFWIDLN